MINFIILYITVIYEYILPLGSYDILNMGIEIFSPPVATKSQHLKKQQDMHKK
tara:strand:+ start:151 stop:309 length:159 start_codon:yes stop_codon:yes gene_type:complete